MQQDPACQQGDLAVRGHAAGLNPSFSSFINMPSSEDSRDAAIDRIMHPYALLMNRSAAASAEARAKVTKYLASLFEAGEKDTHRLTVCGLTYLRELDGSS